MDEEYPTGGTWFAGPGPRLMQSPFVVDRHRLVNPRATGYWITINGTNSRGAWKRKPPTLARTVPYRIKVSWLLADQVTSGSEQ